MAKVDLDSLYKVTAKGRTYYYAWRPAKGEGAEARIHAQPGTPAFVQELAEKLEGRRLGDKSKLGSLITRYKADDAWKGLADKTKQNWSPWLDKIRGKFGNVSIAAFDRPKMRVVIRKWRDTYKATPRAADMGMQVFSRLLSFGIDEGELVNNVVAGLPQLYDNDRSEIIWTPEELTVLEKAASADVYRAARLAGLTGLRQSDLLRLSWKHVHELSIEIPTGKSKNRRITLIPLYAELSEYLETIPRVKGVTTVLTSSRDLPWQTGFGASWQDAVKASGVDKHFHDLRGTAATRFYLAGLTREEIAEILAWSVDHVDTIIRKYVAKDALLRDRIRRMDEARTRNAKPHAKLA